ncbi:MAG: type II toxin-antitoxin system PemK/MazF family toxin [Arcobacter sp.]|uniref:type II toxin-antitoxin system PemK/MazF family toxin n=1 Tax=Arcobacter sp. TaxID=1872629 RepID=UPI003B006443
MDRFFDEWYEVKKELTKNERKLGIKSREIFWANIGQNIGYEQNGKGKNFARPVIVVRKLTKDLFLGIPTTTTLREDNDYFHKFKYTTYNNEVLNVSALILQVKVFSIKRIMNKIGMINKEDFKVIVEKSKNLFGPT